MKQYLYNAVILVSKIHNAIMHLNDSCDINLSDKDLHFLIIGLLGMGMIFVIYPLFRYLAARDRVMLIAWIYVFTVIVVITFAIEIGQKITNTGNMEFADIMYGLIGFMAMFCVFLVIRMVFRGILWLIRYLKR